MTSARQALSTIPTLTANSCSIAALISVMVVVSVLIGKDASL
jgi:hypothetical protein